jgi:hypothetical protein
MVCSFSALDNTEFVLYRNDDHGVGVDYVSRRLNLPEETVGKIIIDQVDLGHLYATIDDHHYKSTMNG